MHGRPGLISAEVGQLRAARDERSVPRGVVRVFGRVERDLRDGQSDRASDGEHHGLQVEDNFGRGFRGGDG